MYLRAMSPSHGHGTSAWPGLSGAPTECMHGMKKPSVPSASSTFCPIRVMIFMCAATYAESVIWMPICAMGDPIGPIENGMTYSVRPSMEPSNSPRRVARIFAGSSQLFVGPARSLVAEQMNVRCSTRATSLGCERTRYEFGRFSGLSWTAVPDFSISAHRPWYSSSDPSHQWIRAGLQRAAASSTHLISFWFLVRASP